MLIKRFSSYASTAALLLVIITTGKAFSAQLSDHNPVNFLEISEYASLANASYRTESEIRKLITSSNYRLSHYNNIPEIQIAYFLLTDDIAKTQIIAVRGTSNIENAIVDVSLQLMLDKHTGVRLHSGFSQAARAIYREIQPQLKTDYVIRTTGHSLGGAVALILAMYMDVDNFELGHIITFGQPKVTNIAGTNRFKHLSHIRVVTPDDLVPLVPPFDPLDLNNLDIYWHSGIEVILLPGTAYAMTEGINSMLRAIKFTQQVLDENNLHNHQMTLYMELVNKKILSARLVPYENSYNLFNLFGSE
jgi:triacylglycerol lipase